MTLEIIAYALGLLSLCLSLYLAVKLINAIIQVLSMIFTAMSLIVDTFKVFFNSMRSVLSYFMDKMFSDTELREATVLKSPNKDKTQNSDIEPNSPSTFFQTKKAELKTPACPRS